MDKTSKCIYCLQEKPETEFNREHVISRMLGTYENAPVLNHNEVCKECNSYFCDELENVVSMDSYEGLLRTQHIQKVHRSAGRPIGKTRLSITGQNGVFSGLTLFVSANPNNPERIQLEAAPAIGIVRDPEKDKYDYYQLDEIPQNNESIRRNMSKSSRPIITFGYEEDEVFSALSSKGYDLSKAKYTGDLDISDVTRETDILIEIKGKVDNILSRLAAKNIMNYLCCSYGKEYVLDPKFDTLRTFIRYGTVSDTIKMCVNNGGLTGIPGRVKNSHVIGTAWAAVDSLYLCGFVSWFGAITYSFLIEKQPYLRVFPDMSFAVCDNQSRVITEYRNPLLVEWPDSKYSISIVGNRAVLIPKANTTNEVKSDA